MGSKLINIVCITIIMFCTISVCSLIITDYETSQSISAVNDFADNVAIKGYLTMEDYNDLLKSIPIKSVQIQLAHIKYDRFSNDSNVVDAVFSTQIFGGMTGGIYKFNVGDVFKIDLYQINQSPFDAIVGALTGSGGSGMKKLVSRSPAISNTKYE